MLPCKIKTSNRIANNCLVFLETVSSKKNANVLQIFVFYFFFCQTMESRYPSDTNLTLSSYFHIAAKSIIKVVMKH